jgi:hypothetical protein
MSLSSWISPSSCLRARLQPCRKHTHLNGALAPEVRSSPHRISSRTPRFLVILLASIFLCFGTIVAQQSNEGYFVPGPIEEARVPNVSLIQLIANPQQYEGKRIRIIGYLHLEFEGDAIYLHREDFEQGIVENAIWINTPKALTDELREAVNDKYVLCTGVFTAKRRGHMGMFSGEISDVNRISPWGRPPSLTPPVSSSK